MHVTASLRPCLRSSESVGPVYIYTGLSPNNIQAVRNLYSAYERVAIDVRARSNEFMDVFSPKAQNLDGINMLLSMLTIPTAAGGAMFYKHSKL